MGKTKTAFVGETLEEKPKKQRKEEPKKVHISGLKGGQRIKVVEAELPTEGKEEKTEGPERPKGVEGKAKGPKVRSKKYQEAKLAYQKAMEMAPTDPKILFNLILVELENKAYEDAKKHYADLKQKEATYASELAVVSLFKEAPVDQPPSVKKDIPVVPAPAPEATPESSSDGVLEETHAY